MRILLAHNSYRERGGEDAVFNAEASLLRRQGNGVIEYTENNGRITNWNRIPAIAHTIWSPPARKKLGDMIRAATPEVVHVHNTFMLISPSAYYACSEAGVAVVQTLHNYRLLCPAATLFRHGHVCEDCVKKKLPWPAPVHGCWRKSKVLSTLPALMLCVHNFLKTWQKQVDVYIALTEFANRKFVEGGLPEEKIVVKPNFIHPDPGVGDGNGNYALYVGRLSEEKGVTTLTKSWETLTGVPLKIAGDGPLMKTLAGLSSFKSIEILGSRTNVEVISYLKASRFLVFPSEWYEGFPITIAEAFACGVPVIASRLGAMEEIVTDGYTGLHFTPGDADDLAAKVEWAWTHEKEMAEMGKNARREYEEKYTAERNYRMLMDIYQLAIERARKRYGSRRRK